MFVICNILNILHIHNMVILMILKVLFGGIIYFICLFILSRYTKIYNKYKKAK